MGCCLGEGVLFHRQIRFQIETLPSSQNSCSCAFIRPHVQVPPSAHPEEFEQRDVRHSGLIASPDEEVWIIAKPKPVNRDAQVVDDTPGTGSMMATLMPDLDDEMTVEGFEKPMLLKHSAVKAQIHGYISTVDVTQKFHNPFSQKIEAVYLFPLPEKSAANEFVMTIGNRKIRGILREKEEAKRLYNEARVQGYRASLMVQHRPNIFEQKVANIEPGHEIDVDIRYFHTLSYEDGWYSFVFPTVVGPRFNPSGFQYPVAALSSSHTGSQPAQGTAIRYLKPGERSGHDLNIEVEIMDLYFDRISYPGMTDLEIEWGQMQVSEVYPRRIPDLFVGKPVVITGKYTGDVPLVRSRVGQAVHR